ncbi:Multidrug resistance-associated protein 7 [Turnera subulata]|uniref:Multidrug resistance-associated protein 7 n=1 Tax=Turnera subulata TaxID=218843 RepID=A0A9Q0FJI1_9ROSI|nr:Multidrug resistance-associated protein 7 [Turnera subulata]
MQVISRIVEPTQGRNMIDVDISKIGLHDLRSSFTIIPQDPTMFKGTVRGNLDPLLSDVQIWEVVVGGDQDPSAVTTTDHRAGKFEAKF